MIIATDKTQLTQFSGSKSAYPVYLTLGNIPRALRRKPSLQACILIAYLPVDKIQKDGLSKKELSARYQRLFHDAMRHVLKPLIEAGKNGVEMTGGDGAVRRVHPIIASYVADYPEQCMVTCSKYGTCPKCQVSADLLDDPSPYEKRTQAWTIDVKSRAMKGAKSSAQYFQACMSEEVSGYTYKPFWEDFEYTDIHLSMTPDILHQLYQGVLKHLIEWCQTAMTPQELDRRIRCLPAAAGLRHFKNGFSALSQISGTERKNMGKILLGCLIGIMPNEAITACRSLLDFIYLAQFPSHDDISLDGMDEALHCFHEHRAYFLRVGIREHFNIPKFHSMHHYVEMIRLFGTTDNYNTEMFERLHIDFAKKGYRASNKRNEFPQMTQWLTRQENVESFDRYIEWAKARRSQTQSQPSAPALPSPSRITVPKMPATPNKSLQLIEKTHKIPAFSTHLKEYLNLYLRRPSTVLESHYHSLPFQGLDVYHSFKFRLESLDGKEETADIVKAQPVSRKQPDGRFDTVIVLAKDSAESVGLTGAWLIVFFSSSTDI